MDRPGPFSDHDTDVGKRAITGFLAGVVGFVISGFLLIPLWLYWPFQVESGSSIAPTYLSTAAGLGYAVAFGVLTAAGISAKKRTLIVAIVLGAAIGALIGIAVRAAMLDSCAMGTGPQPEWCSKKDVPYLRPIVPAYAGAGVVLAAILRFAATLHLGERVPRPD